MGKEYIEREALIKEFDNTFWYHITTDGNLAIGAADEETALYKAPMVIEAANNIPAADVELVRHGKWIEHSEQSYTVHPMKYDEYGYPILQESISYECSICGRQESVKEPYCHCGAKMDEE